MTKQRKCKPYKEFYRDTRRLYGAEARIYGPYVRNSDGRRIVVIYTRKSRTTKLYAKVKLEIKLGRRLSRFETVDHDDGDSRNDKFSNLSLLSLSANSSKAAIRRTIRKVRCLMCGSPFIPTRNQIGPRASTKAGPFCSRTCSGSYGKSIQSGAAPANRKKIQVERYHLNNYGKRTVVS